MPALVAEDLLLLLLDDEKGTLAVGDKARALLGGALVRPVKGTVLGLFPRTTWPATDRTHEAAVRQHLQGVLVQGLTPDARTAALVALLSSVDHAHQVVDLGDLSARVVKHRAKEVSQGDWAAKAVRDAVAATQAAVTAAVVATTAATVGGS